MTARADIVSRPRAPRIARRVRSAARGAARFILAAALALSAGVFILWDADWWIVRDKLVHVYAALFGEYIAPECRADPDKCAARRGGQGTTPAPAGHIPRAPERDACANRPGLELHCQFQMLFDHFNARLFAGRLPAAVITLQRDKGAAGYFAHRRFTRRGGGAMDEIALNPQTFGRVSMREVAATLVHEMVHMEQAHFGTPGSRGFHNAEWGKMMERVGLHPSATGRPGGARTGIRMTHYIIPGGRFERAAKAYPLIVGKSIGLVEGVRAPRSKERRK